MQHHTPQGLLQDLLTPIKQQTWTTFPSIDSSGLNIFPFTTFTTQQDMDDSSSFFHLLSSSIQPTFDQCDESIFPITLPNFTSSSSAYEQHLVYDDKPTSMASIQPTTMVEVEQELLDEKIHEEMKIVDNKYSKYKKVQGQPSKNLMAERRRRKRLNDRLSMLRSIVPRISKMDRTSILGDTIEYTKDLLEKIRNLKEQDIESNSFHKFKINEVQERNTPKFEVERRNIDTRIQICCSTKPGLLLSTINTLEMLGLDIQQGVISSFGDFSLHASCSEALENQSVLSSEEMKQILFRNAGYGGRCL